MEDRQTDGRIFRVGICGVTTNSGKIEWICIKPTHAKIYKRHSNGKPIFSDNPQADQHYFVPRYPNQPFLEES